MRDTVDNGLGNFLTSAFRTWLGQSLFPTLISTLHCGAATLKRIRFKLTYLRIGLRGPLRVRALVLVR